MPNLYEKVKFSVDFFMIHELKKGIHPRPCGMVNLSNIISYGRGTLPNLIDMLAVISNQHLTKNNIRRKAEKCKTAHSSPSDYETRNIVSTSDGVSCAENDE